ncbi:cytochrome d ubiquinol oxidase subunit I [Clostridium saccharoperbutylacetonicum]|uniref:Cytochrome d ubiquinol oxidase subunit 1 n=1 Tax=Clostridium saccharoperbutylacetonicum N1-4(HMT) TaxID=931276 RepID=M1N298_9CLOT|nr:cytochrome ubiquinol oxidase subunit I [Clostridium saccharoperbutylacetonicum]AGF57607.1 cytochrome d ubiquinol oxidase subunit 1 [Clostridium saccharoperbutylacetonicum N1-4(HMT)]NRT61625.1 cytochrome d ubiquinol oxidase subunit I [Clostridium saccharoperbutylacetonicum]NSB24948.1 cytochrome d ubiquinol oxidase subunit I [Clostridium saccharoperbutylacetonicum]NSB44319.1 cytochrome d ubiquinol oxidase subunit I [Clostridium saccharoperbutylacetonicum]
MDNVINFARWQFAITTVYHFFFVPLTIGLGFYLAIMETFYVKTGNEKYKKMVKYWGKLFLINFAMGVVTGLVQEFQFGMNWSNYSRYVGDIFGVPLAIEALLAFFLESTFLGIWVFGWEKVSKKIHLLSIWIVSIATMISAFWILTANSFMHEPVGYTLNNGRAEMTSFTDLITNPHLWVQFPHTIFAALCTGAFFILGISAYHLIKKNNTEWVKSSLKMGIIMALVSSFLVALMGDLQGKYLVKNLPMKMAAAEALWETKDPAPLAVVAIADEENKKNSFEISVPKLLSFMSYNSFTGEVKGINDIQAEYEKKYGPGNYIPQVNLSFYSFRLMVGAGMLMILIGLLGLYFYKKGTIYNQKTLLKLMLLSIALPYLANSSGWILTEVSRAPWIVFGLLKIENAVSPTVSLSYVVTSLVSFALVYTVLAIIDVTLMVKFAKVMPEEEKKNINNKKEESVWI